MLPLRLFFTDRPAKLEKTLPVVSHGCRKLSADELQLSQFSVTQCHVGPEEVEGL
jgi:hypothetical protein